MKVEESFKKKVGQKIKIARSNANITQEALAEKTGLCPRYISQLERGYAFGSANTIIKICEALNINSSFLFTDLVQTENAIELDSLVDTKFLQSYIKLNSFNKQFIDLMTSQLLKLQDETNSKNA